MISLRKHTLVWTITLAFISPTIFAADNEELIEARQGLMMLYSVNMEVLAEMIERKRPYDKQVAQAAADNLLALAKLKTGSLWPAGTSNADQQYKGLTSAKPNIWENRDKIGDLQNKLISKLEMLVKDAAWSLEYVEEDTRDVSDICSSCHKTFRAKR